MTRLQISALGNIGFCLGWAVLYLLLRLSGILDPYKWTLILSLLISIITILLFYRYWRKDGAPVEIDEFEERILMKSYLWVCQGALWYFAAFLIIMDIQKGYAIIQHNLPAFFWGMILTLVISQNLGVLYYAAHPEAARVRIGSLWRWLYNIRKPESASENHPGDGEHR